ncbi:Phthiocerol/phenolphthiocerol synthesis polyketide synthase type I PpsE [Kordia antarctica]|uniref:Phthiocerol/phenolphthiocerol synthesis polyketide synthase type I PpsE n=1 Tax=Kordia antarctica TaxID=1218801 RepID=A0A7L4ZHP6_9FLAO|nr:type I polyketide synthase [Kordia antarctica]QHI35454.1 Phthiocerol/phenolphthiocerol synthesis polyketide synthase type I PpsE [Kordia antarctica]
MKNNYENDIAIIGMAGKFPKAKNIAEYWKNLKSGVNSIQAADAETIRNLGINENTINNPLFINASSRLENAKYFDADFFGLSNAEAILMDPQIRLLLENSWHALEDAGYAGDNSDIAIANYCGMSTNSYLMRILGTNALTEPVDFLMYRILNEKDFLATWISYKLNLTGAAMTVQTACSTSLLAVHLACQGLLNHECDMAMAGGVSFDSSESIGYFYIPESIYARDGVCRPFDKNASGTVMGSGVATVILKRAEDAIRDKDQIYGLIKGTAVNNDGSNKQGYSTPSVNFQRDVILEALAVSDINPDSIGMIEAHGTGTKIGDPIEVTALSEAFREYTTKDQFCALGSVKANIGHLDAAAGVASLIKAVMCVNEGVLPPNINYNEANPALQLKTSPFYVNKSVEPWSDSFEIRRAGISSLGVGGTNVHVIVEQPPTKATSTKDIDQSYIISLSAENLENLQKQKENLVNYITATPEIDLRNIEYTTLYCRKLMPYRFNAISHNKEELLSQLASEKLEGCFESKGELTSGVFVFPGQGSQYSKMAYDLYNQNLAFKKDMDTCFEFLTELTATIFKDIIFSDDQQEALNQTQNTQVALFIVEYCLAKELIRNGIKPKAMIGHSLGEYVAACIAEVFTLQEALTLVYHRGRLMGMMPKGSMAIVRKNEEELTPLLMQSVSICVYNIIDSVVIGGETAAIDKQIALLKSQEINCEKLRVSHAFHTSMMAGVLEEFTAILSKINFKEPSVSIYSTYTGKEVSSKELTSGQYWLDQIMNPVQFTEAVDQVRKNVTNPVFIEVGPGNGLSSFIKAAYGQDMKTVHMLPSSSDTTSALLQYTRGKALLNNLGIAFSKPENALGKTISLPGYAFSKNYFWKPQLQIGYENFEDIKVSHHQKNEKFENDRLRLTVEVGMQNDKHISEELLNDLDQIHKEYRKKIKALFPNNNKVISERIEVLYNDIQHKETTGKHAITNTNLETRRGNSIYVEPETEMAKVIAGIWGEVLGYEKVGILDNYFEMGGNSLLATQLLNRILIRTEVELTISDILTKNTLKELVQLVESKKDQHEGSEYENELII